jgi:hypothetical protein
MAFVHLADRRFEDRRRSRGKAEVFDGRRSPHPAAADLFHSLLAARGPHVSTWAKARENRARAAAAVQRA